MDDKASGKMSGLSIELQTFEHYGKSAIIGHKTSERDGKIFVNQIWCKLCAKHQIRHVKGALELLLKLASTALIL